MMTNTQKVLNWRLRTKQRMVDAFGGKCGICEYKKYIGGLEFHHLISEEKERGVAGMIVNPAAWHKIVHELRKCVCLCSRCHREIHGEVTQLPRDIKRFDESFADYKKAYEKEMNPCPICQKPKWAGQQTCSYECAAKKAWKVDWSSVDLYDLYVVKKTPKITIAAIVGCSDAAVNKRLKKLNLL